MNKNAFFYFVAFFWSRFSLPLLASNDENVCYFYLFFAQPCVCQRCHIRDAAISRCRGARNDALAGVCLKTEWHVRHSYKFMKFYGALMRSYCFKKKK